MGNMIGRREEREVVNLLRTEGEAKSPRKGRAWEIAGNDPKLYNDPGQPRRVDIVEKKVRGVSRKLQIPPISATLFALPAKE